MVNGWLSSRATFLNDPWERTRWLFNSRFTRQQGRKAAIETDLEVVDILQADAERVGLELDSDDGADQRIEISNFNAVAASVLLQNLREGRWTLSVTRR